jgi:hypothetical protein
MKYGLGALLLGSVGLCVIGCGGGSGSTTGGSGTCGKVEPCGGTLTGSWVFTGECVNAASLQPEARVLCAQASIGIPSVNFTGTLSFNGDMTYSISETVDARVPWNIPATCTGGMTCPDFGTDLEEEMSSGETFTCTGSGACACTQTALLNTNDTGTYSTTGSTLLLTSASTGMTIGGGYCVQGSTLHLITLDTTMSMGVLGQTTIDRDVTAQAADGGIGVLSAAPCGGTVNVTGTTPDGHFAGDRIVAFDEQGCTSSGYAVRVEIADDSAGRTLILTIPGALGVDGGATAPVGDVPSTVSLSDPNAVMSTGAVDVTLDQESNGPTTGTIEASVAFSTSGYNLTGSFSSPICDVQLCSAPL